jgi:hypothetical protein
MFGGSDMGMDVIGRNPTAPEGEYFRASIWHWPLLVKVITSLYRQETSSCKAWEYNDDDDGLDREQAFALAEALEQKLRSGEVAYALCDPSLISTPKMAIAVAEWCGSQGMVIEHPAHN